MDVTADARRLSTRQIPEGDTLRLEVAVPSAPAAKAPAFLPDVLPTRIRVPRKTDECNRSATLRVG